MKNNILRKPKFQTSNKELIEVLETHDWQWYVCFLENGEFELHLDTSLSDILYHHLPLQCFGFTNIVQCGTYEQFTSQVPDEVTKIIMSKSPEWFIFLFSDGKREIRHENNISLKYREQISEVEACLNIKICFKFNCVSVVRCGKRSTTIFSKYDRYLCDSFDTPF